MSWYLTLAESNRLGHDYWLGKLPSLLRDLSVISDRGQRKLILVLSEELQAGWDNFNVKLNTLAWDSFDVKSLWNTYKSGHHILMKMFLEIPDPIKHLANYADAIILHTADLFLNQPFPKFCKKIRSEMTAIQLSKRCLIELRHRAEATPCGRRLYLLKMNQDFGYPLFEENLFDNLLADLRPSLRGLWLPDEAKSHQEEAKDEIIQERVAKTLNVLKDCTPEEMVFRCHDGEFETLRNAVPNDFISELRKQTGPERMPEGGVQSLDQVSENVRSDSNPEKELSHGSIEGLINEIETADSRLGKLARVYFEAYAENKKRPTQLEVADCLEVTDRTVRNHLQELRVFLEKKIEKK